MKAIGYKTAGSIDAANALEDIELDKPTATGRDILVKVSAIAVNPVDFKIRQNVSPTDDEFKVLGWDAVGEVVATGEEAHLFNHGDKVYYAGDLTRPGSNAEYKLVDERLVAKKPASISDAEAAAMPLTSITAWELLFERLAIPRSSNSKATSPDVLLVVGASGGVGSILIRYAKALTNAVVIATASRPSTQKWVKELGADFVIDHSQSLVEQINALEVGPVTHVASLTHTNSYLEAYVDALKPMGKIALIDDPETLDVKKLKAKSISLHWEFMFTRSMFSTDDMIVQHQLLTETAELIDQGIIKSTLNQTMGSINAHNLREAHRLLESGKAIGKIVLGGFDS